jgi:hypothetical protein
LWLVETKTDNNVGILGRKRFGGIGGFNGSGILRCAQDDSKGSRVEADGFETEEVG